MALTREQALDLLRTMRRKDLSPPRKWYAITSPTPAGKAPPPGVKLCPTLALAVAGGFNMDTFFDVVHEEDWSIEGVLGRLQPYTSLTYDELDALRAQHDADPRSKRRLGTPEPEYLNAVLGVQQ